MKVLLGKKIGMTQIFQEEKVVPVTLIQAGPCRVTQVKTKEKDGYVAVQLGFEEITKKKNITKSKRQKPFVYVREFPTAEGAMGQVIDASVFQDGDTVQVSGISKGKGFQGAVKRHGFHGAPATHGTKHAHRQPGSIGATWPQRVIKGMRMAGRMGGVRMSTRNLEIAKVDAETNTLAIKGAIPGKRGTLVEIRG